MKKIILFLYCCLISFPGLSLTIPAPSDYSYDKNCPTDKPFRANVGREYLEGEKGCLSCDELKSIRLNPKNKADFDRCPNRKTVETTSGIMSSRLKKCPESHPLRALDGSCVSCEEPKSVQIKDKKDCDICANRRTEIWVPETENYSCYFKKCPENFPLFSEGDCLACDAPYWTHDDKKTCDKCPNRQYIKIPLPQKIKNIVKGETSEGCYLKPEQGKREPLFEVKVVDRIRMPMSGNPYYQRFYSCNEEKDIETIPEVCAKCPNRDYKDGKCIFRECAEGSVKSENNEYCLWCDDSICNTTKSGKKYCYDYPFKTSKEKCHKCPNRFLGVDVPSLIIPSSEEEQCMSCKNIDDIIYTSAEECARCPDFIYDPETKLCGKEERVQNWKESKKRLEVVDFPRRPSLDTLELAPLPLSEVEAELVPLPMVNE